MASLPILSSVPLSAASAEPRTNGISAAGNLCFSSSSRSSISCRRHATAAARRAELISRTDTPLNEFEENAEVIGGAFPLLFPLGQPLQSFGAPVEAGKGGLLGGVSRLVPSALRHMLLQHDAKHAQSRNLLFLLSNQKLRHATIGSVTARLKGDPQSLARWATMVGDEAFWVEVEQAERAPEGAQAKRVLARLLPILNVCGKDIPFSSAERNDSNTRMMALTRLCGTPSVYMTVSARRGRELVREVTAPEQARARSRARSGHRTTCTTRG